jgi:hypothetical protein
MKLSFRGCLALASLMFAAYAVDVPAALAARSAQTPHRQHAERPVTRSDVEMRAHLPFVSPVPPQKPAKDPFADMLLG